jgi:exonuclease SbcC
LARELAAIEESRRREGSYQKSIEEHETELARARKALVTARDERKALSGKLAALQGEIGSRQRAREKLAVAIAVLEETQASHGACAEAVNETTSRIRGLKKDLEAANEVAKKAQETRDVASKKLERLKVDNQVAAIAGHLHAGEDCPVCNRSLPKNFKAPHSADLAKAAKGLDEVRSALESAQRKANTIEGQLNELPARLTKDRKALTAAERVRKKAESTLEALLPSPGDKPEKVIAGHDRFLVKAEEGLRTWREDLTKRDGALSTLQTDETKALTNIEHCTRERGNCRRSIDAGVGKCEKLRAGVPEAYRPDDAGASLKNTIETVRKAIGQAEALRDRVGQATQSLATVGQALQTAEGAYGRDVREPRARTLERMKAIAKSANAPAAPNDEKKLDDWAQTIGDAATSLHRKLRDDIEAEEKRLRTLADAQTAIRKELGDLEPRIAENLATVAKTRAEEQVKIAHEKVMKAGEFDAAIVRMEKIQMGLAGVKEALGGQKSAFPSYATQQRQQRLIEEANLILLEMTKGRFTFTSQFDILDSESNEERPSQTLSGGEKFLASLALSLGVVEIATNSGSRIESVFLDEGFDALDTHKLELAMLELRRRARAGRMIGVITHVHEVTKFLNDTILVTTTPEGSQFTHTGAVDEDDEKVEGLITHLTGDAAAI